MPSKCCTFAARGANGAGQGPPPVQVAGLGEGRQQQQEPVGTTCADLGTLLSTLDHGALAIAC